MKTLQRITPILICLLFAAAPLRAASDADVTLLKVKKVVIEDTAITIEVTEAKTQITLIRDGHDPKFKGDTWHGMPVSRVQVISNKATFIIKRGAHSAPGGPLENAWKDSLKAAKDLQDGKESGGIGFYEPDIVIKGNMIESIAGTGFLHKKEMQTAPAKPKADPKLEF